MTEHYRDDTYQHLDDGRVQVACTCGWRSEPITPERISEHLLTVVRAGDYGGAVGDPSRWPPPGSLPPAGWALHSTNRLPAHRREDLREGSARLRQALSSSAVDCASTTRLPAATPPSWTFGASRAR